MLYVFVVNCHVCTIECRSFPSMLYIVRCFCGEGFHSPPVLVVSRYHPKYLLVLGGIREHIHPLVLPDLYPAIQSKNRRFRLWRHKRLLPLPSEVLPFGYKLGVVWALIFLKWFRLQATYHIDVG